MKPYCLIFCCIIFTTAATFRSVDASSEHDNDSLTLSAKAKNCICENGRCFTDKEGNTKCACKPGYSLLDEFTCKPCDCGSLGKCIFALKEIGKDEFEYQKKCVCDAGCAVKDGVCVNCHCGEHSSCDFDYGERRCYCIEGYSEKDGICTRCDCGFYGKCKYHNGVKQCECDKGYLELNGICEACDCGSNSDSCGFVNGVKQCKCKDKYADRYGTCEECDCGVNSRNCSFKDNQKTCNCLEGYVQKGETCQLGCSVQNPCQNGGYCKEGFCYCQNGTRGEFCEVIEECSTLCPKQADIQCSYDIASQKAYCRCLNRNLRYDPNRKQCRLGCSAQQPCQNGGYCKDGFCICQKGTRGEFCEVIDECSYLCPNQSGVRCSYHVPSQRAYCWCQNGNLRYDPNTRQCRGNNCQYDQHCVNGVCRNGMCVCAPGYSGDRCEIVDCLTGAIRCMDHVNLLYRGRNTLYILWKGWLMKYVRENVVLPYVNDCQAGTRVQCNNHYDFFWCHGGYTVNIPIAQNQVLRYRRVDSTSEICGRSSMVRTEPYHQI